MRDKFDDVIAAGIDRRTLLKYTGALAASAALTVSLAACSAGTPASKASGSTALGTAKKPAGTITATSAFLLSGGFDPMNASSAVATCVNQHIFEGLVDLDPITRSPYAALASAIPTSSDGGMTWKATLRSGAKFSDGSPVTADDVVWSFTRVVDPANQALLAPFLSFLDTVTAVDDRNIEFKLKTPFELFPVRSAAIKIVPKAKTATAAAATAFNNAPVGSGPFKLDTASATTGVTMSNNVNYNGPRPALVTSVVMRTTTDDAARLNDLQGGSSQAIEEVPYLNAASVSSPDKVDVKQGFNLLFLMFNCSAAPFNDQRVRQALFYAIDTKSVIATALNGYGTAASSYLDTANADYQKAETVYSYNPTKAKALLKAAGVSSLKFELVTTNTGFIADSAPVLIDNWKSIGVTATLNTQPSATVYSQLVPESSFRVLAASGDPTVYGTDTDLLLRWYYASSTWMTSRSRWTGAEFDELSTLISQASSQSGSAQKATWKKAIDLVAEQVPLYPVYHTKTITGEAPSELVNFQGAATTGLYFLDVARSK